MASVDAPPLPMLVDERVRAWPDRIALTSVDQGSVTWSELRSASHRWVNWLRRHGVEDGDKVVTLIPQSREAAYAWLACSALGAVEVSINAASRGDWLRHALTMSSAKVAVLSRRFLAQTLPRLEGTGVEILLVYDAANEPSDAGAVRVVVGRPAEEGDALAGPQRQREPHDPACVFYTSGTTGASKAVLVPWRQFVLALAVDPEIAEPERQVF